ncbi:MAG: hypothetical protein AB1482_11040 [Pseudomonadota bacterium]
MPAFKRTLSCTAASLLALGVLGGCASQAPAKPESKPAASAAPAATVPAGAAVAVTAPAAQPAAAATDHYFMVFHENGRIYAFGDTRNYLLFLEHDEVPLTRTRIGAGPEGETIVFGITNDDAKKLETPSKGEMFYDGKVGEVGPFYGEVVRDGRFYVFGEWKDFKDYLAHREVTYTFTEVGAGPKGETVIYALNKDTVKQGRPTRLIEQFKALHKLN